MMENPIKMDDLGVPLFSETSRYKLEVGRGGVLRYHYVKVVSSLSH